MSIPEDDFTAFRALIGLGLDDLETLRTLGRVETIRPRTELIVRGRSPENLYYVLEGEMLLEKPGRIRRIGPNSFIGELSFVLKKPAVATVTFDRGGRALSWPVSGLRALIESNTAIAAAFDRAFKIDLANKVSES